jgi:uncharacterized protein YbcI
VDDTTQHDTPQTLEGSDFADVSRRLVQLHKEVYGRGPTKARSFMSDDVLVCLLEGGYMPMERALREHGRGDLVNENREAMQDVMRERFVAEVEDITGRKVKAFMSTADQHSELAAEVFVFDGPDPELGSEEQAISGWGDQVRRQSRELREKQAELREEQARLIRERPHPEA